MKVGEIMDKIRAIRKLQDELDNSDTPITEVMRGEMSTFLGEYIDMLQDMKVQR